MTDWNRVERLLGEDALSSLGEKTVGVVGLGSGGGYVALSLAMTGVQHFVLVDDDVLDAANVVRHVADRRYLEQPKVAAMAALLHERNPAVQVDAINGRIEDHLDVLDRLNLLVVGVDTEVVKFTLNEACLERNLTAVYAGVYERGEGGDAVVIKPKNGPCYACWAENLRETQLTMSDAHTDANLDYGQLREDGTLNAEPGLWLDVVRVANIQANLALNVLLNDTPVERDFPANTVIVANQFLEIIESRLTPPFAVEWVNIARNPQCLVCGVYYGDTAHAVNELSLEAALRRTHGEETTEMEQEQEQENDG